MAAKRKRGRKPLLISALLVAGLMAMPTATVVVAGMIPTLVAWCVDPGRRRLLSLSVAMTNLVGVLIVLFHLWDGKQTVTRAVDLISHPFGLFAFLASAGVGWVIYSLVPPLAARSVRAALQRRLAELEKNAQQLEEIWGEGVKQGVAAAADGPGPKR